MSKLKAIMSAGILVASGTFSTTAPTADNTMPVTKETHTSHTPQKRNAQKVYHRYEEIPEISDEDAVAYQKDEYTYIINAEHYQQTGEIELKRVLVAEVTQANTLSLIYRSECGTHIPSENEDKITCYDVDMKLINPSGIFAGPSQMDSNTIKSYIKFLAISPKTQKYVLPLLQYTPSKNMPKTLTEVLDELTKQFYTETGSLRPIKERNALIQNKYFKQISIKNNAWNDIASPKLKKFIATEESKRKETLSNVIKSYLCLTELLPSTEIMRQSLEDYNLTSYSLGRQGKPNQVILTLALSMNLKDNDGNLDATRVPTYAIAASVSHINWKGNGNSAIHQASNLRQSFKQSREIGLKNLRQTVKQWVTGKSRTHGVDELSQLNMITPLIIEQYQKLELAGAEKLAQNYQKLVKEKEAQIPQTNLTLLISNTLKQQR